MTRILAGAAMLGGAATNCFFNRAGLHLNRSALKIIGLGGLRGLLSYAVWIGVAIVLDEGICHWMPKKITACSLCIAKENATIFSIVALIIVATHNSTRLGTPLQALVQFLVPVLIARGVNALCD